MLAINISSLYETPIMVTKFQIGNGFKCEVNLANKSQYLLARIKPRTAKAERRL